LFWTLFIPQWRSQDLEVGGTDTGAQAGILIL